MTRNFFASLGVRACAAGLLLATASAASAQQGDRIFGNSMEAADIPASESEASRFLQQATFGATRGETQQLAQSLIGLEGWMNSQFALTQTLARPFLEQRAATLHASNQRINQDDRVHRWFDTAVRAPDQLRQRMAYALSQIIVVSDRNDALGNEPIMMAEWNDLLVRNAFGNYRDLLREATYSPMMGIYLTSMRNRKYEVTPTCLNAAGNGNTDCNNDNTSPFTITQYAAGNNASQPDENYAREVMQLFSIGLVDRQRNFFTLIDNDPVTPGVQAATYDQQMITTLSRAFTGLSYDCTGNATVNGISIPRNCGTAQVPCAGPDCRFSNASTNFFNSPPRARLPNNSDDSSIIHPDYYRPMVCYPRYSDNGRDMRRFELPGSVVADADIRNTTLSLGAGTIPGGTPTDVKTLRLSNVDFDMPEFMEDASKETVIDCNATGATALTQLSGAQRQQCTLHCDLQITAAIDLLFNHPNTAPMVARTLIQRFVTSNPTPAYVQRVAQRFENNGAGVRGDMKAVIKAVLLDNEARQGNVANFGKPREPMMKLVHVWRAYGAVSADNRRWGPTNPQDAYFQRPLGAPSVFNFFEPDYQQPGAIAEAGLYSPEFQIISEDSVMRTANDLYGRICAGYGGGNCSGNFTAPTDRAYIPTAVLDALPTDNIGLIEDLNVRMMGGRMSGVIGSAGQCNTAQNTGMKGVLNAMLQCGLVGLGNDQNGRRRKALYLIHMVAISPEYAMQR